MELNDKHLIEKAKKGDMTAFETLVKRYDKHVLNIAYSFRNDAEDAKDIYQEVFMRVYKGLKNFQFRSEFSTWLFRITTNVCISFKNQKNRHFHESLDREILSDDDSKLIRADLIDNGDIGTDLKVAVEDTNRIISECIERLPPKQKLAFTLKYFQEYKIREIAEIMECTEGTIKKYLFTSVNKIRTQLKPILET